jgi:hypothetical protein
MFKNSRFYTLSTTSHSSDMIIYHDQVLILDSCVTSFHFIQFQLICSSVEQLLKALLLLKYLDWFSVLNTGMKNVVISEGTD